MIDHIKLFVSDVGRSRRFYEHALAPLGYRVILEPAPEVVGMGAGMPDFWLAPAGGEPRPTGHVAFRAAGEEVVRAFHRAGLEAGGRDNGPRARARSTTRATSARSSSTPTATTSRPSSTGAEAAQCGCSPVAAGGRDSSASEVMVSPPRAESSSTPEASSAERA